MECYKSCLRLFQCPVCQDILRLSKFNFEENSKENVKKDSIQVQLTSDFTTTVLKTGNNVSRAPPFKTNHLSQCVDFCPNADFIEKLHTKIRIVNDRRKKCKSCLRNKNCRDFRLVEQTRGQTAGQISGKLVFVDRSTNQEESV